MKFISTLATLVVASFTLLGTAAHAQFVKGNEAVKVMPDGTKRIETPPLPLTGPIRNTKPCLAKAGCHGGAWLMVETRDGLVECTDAYARPDTCRTSSYGKTKLMRLWVVKVRGSWQQCQLPDVASRCVDMFARPPGNLPYPAVQ